jgi:nitrite reductase/ring-hydroxylating ferredoxin subunit
MSGCAYIHVADTAELPPGAMKLVEAHGAAIVLANVDGELRAFAGECTHDGGPLAEGRIEHGAVTCPWHFSRFCVRSGRVLESPAETPLAVYDVAIDGSAVLVGAPRARSSLPREA